MKIMKMKRKRKSRSTRRREEEEDIKEGHMEIERYLLKLHLYSMYKTNI